MSQVDCLFVGTGISWKAYFLNIDRQSYSFGRGPINWAVDSLGHGWFSNENLGLFFWTLLIQSWFSDSIKFMFFKTPPKLLFYIGSISIFHLFIFWWNEVFSIQKSSDTTVFMYWILNLSLRDLMAWTHLLRIAPRFFARKYTCSTKNKVFIIGLKFFKKL